jgi:hypothetical protein
MTAAAETSPGWRLSVFARLHFPNGLPMKVGMEAFLRRSQVGGCGVLGSVLHCLFDYVM